MKIKHLLLLAVAAVFAGCDPNIRSATDEDGNPLFNYRVIVIEGCEYLHSQGEGSVCHKGNCTNRIHIYNIE